MVALAALVHLVDEVEILKHSSQLPVLVGELEKETNDVVGLGVQSYTVRAD